jgi:hypothetical protein
VPGVNPVKVSVVELEVADFAQVVHLLDEKHRVVLIACHKQIIVSESKQAIELKFSAVLTWTNWLTRY